MIPKLELIFLQQKSQMKIGILSNEIIMDGPVGFPS